MTECLQLYYHAFLFAILAAEPVVSLTLSKPLDKLRELQANETLNVSLDDLRLGPRWTPLPDKEADKSLNIWVQSLESQRKRINSLPLHSAKSTDRVAITFLQPAMPENIDLMAQIARLNMHRLGPTWALQIYYCNEEERESLERLLGRPENVVWARIMLRGQNVSMMSRIEFSWFMLSMDFWSKVPERFDHVLIFGDDSIVLKGPGCVEKFLEYDYVGAPWHEDMKIMPLYGGNGGFRLCRRNSSIAAVQSPAVNHFKATDPRLQRAHEDHAFVVLIHKMGGTFPPREVAASFSVETVYQDAPCGVHKPWRYQPPDDMRRLLESADPLG